MAKPKGAPQNMRPVRTKEEAIERGRAGGIKSGEVRRAQRDAKSAIKYLLGLKATGKMKQNLIDMGYPDDECTNMSVINARLFASAVGGSLEAYTTLMKMAGYEPEETRKERESIASDKRRNQEMVAKVKALERDGPALPAAINIGDEDGNNDVVIYLPEIEEEKDCEIPIVDVGTQEEPEKLE